MSRQLNYKRPWYLFNGHLESAIPYWRYKIYEIAYERERLELPDGDFLDLDWIRDSNKKLIVISHALEGNTRDYFVERAAKYFSSRGFDILMWHYRGCSKEMNRLPRFYHLGNTDDLQAVIQYGLQSSDYEGIYLIGFSMGGVTTLNYLAKEKLPSTLKAATVFSTPFDLEESSQRMRRGLGKVYGQSFLKKWKRRILRKAEMFPDLFDLEHLEKIKNLEDLHTNYTLHLHGFKSLEQFYSQFSPNQHLEKIEIPLLIVNAQNDPILGSNSYSKIRNSNIEIDSPKRGGHLGFSLHGKPYSWMELRAQEFFDIQHQ